MVTHGTANHQFVPAAAKTNARAPQAKIRTAPDTAMRCAASKPTCRASHSNSRSNSTLVDWGTIWSPWTCPFEISDASQTLYTWLERSPAWIRDCQKQGTRKRMESTATRIKLSRVLDFSPPRIAISSALKAASAIYKPRRRYFELWPRTNRESDIHVTLQRKIFSARRSIRD